NGITVSLRHAGFLGQHIDAAMEQTAPLTQTFIAAGGQEARAWIDAQIKSPVAELRALAVRDEVDFAIETAARRAPYRHLSIDATDESAQLTAASSQALATANALMTVVQRFARAHADHEGELDKIFAKTLPKVTIPPGLNISSAENILSTINHLQ